MKYSIIIPVYNAEDTLDRCIKSIITQLRDNAEVILIDDGSNDSSYSICLKYQEIYPDNIQVIHQKNNGVSSARNRGLDAAKGEYIIFVDSDDYIEPDFLSAADSIMQDKSFDLIMFAFKKVKNNKMVSRRKLKEIEAYSRKEAVSIIIEMICRKTINNPVAKVYRKSIIDDNKIRFPIGVSIAEDRAFNIKYSLFINSLRITNKVIYNVTVDNENSLSRAIVDPWNEDYKKSENYINNAIITSGISDAEVIKYKEAFKFCECRSVIQVAKLGIKEGIDKKTRLSTIKEECEKINSDHTGYPNLIFCKIISLPVKLKMSLMIDLMARYLLR